MTLTLTAKPASTKQINWIRDLLAERPNWHDELNGQHYETAFDILGNVDNPNPKFIELKEASTLIGKLLTIKPSVSTPPKTGQAPSAFQRLQLLLKSLKPGYYALPREDDTETFNFYRIVEIEHGQWKGRRFINQLVGSPSGWNKIRPKMDQQLQLVRKIAVDPDGALKAYAKYHTKCSRCNADLSNPRSQVALIGEHCAGIWGWPW